MAYKETQKAMHGVIEFQDRDFFMSMFLLILISSPFAQFMVNQEPWIRVGLGTPSDQPLFFYNGKLQIYDGQDLVSEIQSTGKFWVIRDRVHQEAYCLRVLSGETRELEPKLDELRKKFPSVSYHIIKHSGKKYAFLETGRIPNKELAEDLAQKHRDLGFQKVVLIKLEGTNKASLVLVDRNFDKRSLGPLKNPVIRPADPNSPVTYAGKEYRGHLYLKWDGKAFRVINFLPVESYLRGVVPGEMGPVIYPRLEALKAQAVAARTYALKNMGKFESQGFDICDTPRCQVYLGVQVEHELTDQAIAETNGQVLASGGVMIDALYTSTCGGATDPVANVFPERDGKGDPYLAGASSYLEKNSGWNMTLPANSKMKDFTDVQIRAYLLGIRDLDLKGPLDSKTLADWLKDLEPLFGSSAPVPAVAPWTGRLFLDQIASLPFIQRSSDHQCTTEDILRFQKYSLKQVPVGWFFLLRYGALKIQDIEGVELNWSKERALEVLVHLAETFGPEPKWQRFFVDNLTENGLVIRDWNGVYDYPLANLELVLSKSGEEWKIQDHIFFQMWDKVFLQNGSQDSGVIYLQPNGWSASVDRSSPYSSWLEKKTIAEIEELTQKYISKIKGIRDLKIVSQSPTGRVTEMLVVSDSGNFPVTGLTIRRILGIRDNLFEFLPQYKNGRLNSATFVGKGWGHGVGMSQVGAFGLALEGWTYEQILKHYYFNVEIVQANTLSNQ